MRSMAFGTRPSTESSIRVVTGQDVVDGEVAVEVVELAEVSESGDCAVEEACICFAPSIALNRTVG